MENVKLYRVLFLQLLWVSYGELVVAPGGSIDIANQVRLHLISSGDFDIEKKCIDDDFTSVSPEIKTTETPDWKSTSPIVPCQVVIPNIYSGGKCPANFTYLNDGYCYYFSNATTSWDKSLAQCESLNATLACPDTPYRNLVLRTYLKDVLHLNASSTAYWFGGYFDNSTMSWRWQCNNNKIECFDWCPKEPNNYGDTEWCLSYNPQNNCDIHWNDRTCSWWGFRAICQAIAKY